MPESLGTAQSGPEPTVSPAERSRMLSDLAKAHPIDSGGTVGHERRITRRDQSPALTKRALIIAMVLVGFIAAFTPFNDYILGNSPFIGNHFPIGIIFLMAMLVLVLNPALTLLKKRPLQTGELVVITTMMLVSAAVPSSGLMRYLEPMLVSPFRLIQESPWLKPIAELVPSWLVPTQDPDSPLISNYWLGIERAHGESIPILPFLIPQILWGILIAAILAMAMFLAALFRRQWVHNERLAYPLATLPLELLAAPEQGRYLNKLWRNPILWAGAAIPFFVYILAGLHEQFPGVPYIRLQYDFRNAFTEAPWNAMPGHIVSGRLFLAVVGITFFIPSEIAFSLWLFLLVNGAVRVLFARSSIDPGLHEPTRAMGIYVGYFAGILWLARGHLKYVVLAAWRKTPREEGEIASYRTILVGFVGAYVVALVWLVCVGMNPVIAALLLGLGVMLMTLMSRVVAETGLFFVGPMWWPQQFILTLLGPKITTMASLYWSQIVSRIFFADLRENIMPFATNALRMGQEVRDGDRGRWFKWLFIALALAILVSGSMHHYLSYAKGREAIGDRWATRVMPYYAMQDTFRATSGEESVPVGRSWLQVTFGLLLVGTAMVGRVLFVAWPFHPIGLVLMGSWPLQVFWFSIFIGWGTKMLLLHYGGAAAFKRARPFFIGLLIGEILSAGGWMFVGLITNGHIRYTFLPG